MRDLVEIQNWLTAEWVEQLRQVLESMAGQAPEIVPAPPGTAEQAITLGWEHPLSAGPNCMFWAGAAEPAWKLVGSKVLAAAGVEDSEPDDLRSTYIEILSQVNSGVAQKISGRTGREVTTLEGREVRVPPKGSARLAFELRFAGADPVYVHFAITAGLEALFAAADRPSPQPSPAPADTAPGSKTLDLLLEVELPVSVSFGRAQLQLKDVLKLTTGSIVELNRSIIEPVEIIVNNCVIARGEVVVIDGNYGVRITHVISRQERLRTLN